MNTSELNTSTETVITGDAGEVAREVAALIESTPAGETPAKGNKRNRKGNKKTLAQDFSLIARETAKVWADSIALRVGKLQDAGKPVAVEWALIGKTLGNESFPNALALLIGSGSIETETLTRILPTHEGRGTGYVQAKTVQKIVNMIFTLAAGDVGKLSDYTSQVLYHALQNHDALSIDGARASLSKRCSRIDLPNRENIDKPANYSTGTASSQASQVREVLRVLGLATVEKYKKGDTFKLNEKRVEALRGLYALEATGEGE